jgi:hypothetical protein
MTTPFKKIPTDYPVGIHYWEIFALDGSLWRYQQKRKKQ